MTASELYKKAPKVTKGTDGVESKGDFYVFDGTQKLGTDYNFKREIVWKNAIGFLLLHIAALYGFYLACTEAKRETNIFAFVLDVFATLGVTMGTHRLFTHKSFKATPTLRAILLLLHTIAGQNCCYIWVRDHRQHHKYSDTDADPHNANRGFFFSHVGWLMSRKHPLVKEYGKKIDMSDLEADKLVMFEKKYYKILYLIFAVLFPIITPIYFWNESLWNSIFVSYFARYIIMINGTWSVNSWAHFYGNRPFDKGLNPVESWLVSFLSIGEGWHNYHHAFPWDYKASELGAPFNLTRKTIDLCAALGLAYDLKTVSPEMARKRQLRTGDGTLTFAEMNASDMYFSRHGPWSFLFPKNKQFIRTDENGNLIKGS